MIDSYKRQIAELRAYLAELAPDSYEAARIRLAIAMRECLVVVLESFTPATRWLGVLISRVAGWWVDFTWTLRAIRVVLREMVATFGDAVRGAKAEAKGMAELNRAIGMDKYKWVTLQILEDGRLVPVRWLCPKETTEAEILEEERALNANVQEKERDE